MASLRPYPEIGTPAVDLAVGVSLAFAMNGHEVRIKRMPGGVQRYAFAVLALAGPSFVRVVVEADGSVAGIHGDPQDTNYLAAVVARLRKGLDHG